MHASMPPIDGHRTSVAQVDRMAGAAASWSRTAIALVAAGGLLLWLSRRGMETRIPFGPYLAFAGLLGILFGRQAVVYWIGYFPA